MIRLLLALVIACLVVGVATAADGDVAYGPAKGQSLSVHAPRNPHDAPILVMVHGGAWMIGDKDSPGVIESKVSYWGAQGVIVVSVDYRLWPTATPLQQAGDVVAALAFVQGHAREWHGDPARIVLMGHSAGAHLVTLLAASPDIVRSAGVAPWLATVSLDSAAVDLPELMRGPHMPFYDRVFGTDPTGWAAASPLDLLRQAPAAPILMVCSLSRKLSCPANKRFSDRVIALGGRSATLPVALDHAQINRTLGVPGPYTDHVDAWLKGVGFP